MSAALTSADAVRLARFARPQFQDWEDPDAQWETSPGTRVRCLHRLVPNLIFDLEDLNDIALAEQRVVAAGLGDEYSDLLNPLIGGYDSCDASRHCFTTATAEQRARALLALLDAHPELPV